MNNHTLDNSYLVFLGDDHPLNDRLLTEYGYECAERAGILQFMAGYSVEEAEKLAIEEYNRKQNEVS